MPIVVMSINYIFMVISYLPKNIIAYINIAFLLYNLVIGLLQKYYLVLFLGEVEIEVI